MTKQKITQIPDIFNAATFDEIKSALTDWMRNQEEFKDFDFNGAGINVLMDLLAYNTLYIQQFANAALYESFIRTAIKRSSVVQAAQDLGYLPASKTSASTTIMLHVTHPRNPASIRIPRGTKFIASVDRQTSYPFVTTEDVVSVLGSNGLYTPMLKVAQGRIVRTEMLFDPKKQILIRDPDIDRAQVKLWVDGAEWKDWTRESIVNATGASNIFYMRETVDGHTEIFFGEGESTLSAAGGALEANYIGGLKPSTGANIVIEYISTKGAEANGSVNFTYADTLASISIVKIIENPTNDRDYVGADGGGDPESIERIRELAPVMRESQRRCVTASDYEAFVSSRFGSIVQAVQCFTDREKPGYAFVAVKPKSGLRLTTVQKEDMRDYLAKYNLAPITPSIIDPNYLYIKQNIKVSYSINDLSESEQWLRGAVIDQIDAYYTDEVEIFNQTFSKSKMLARIDKADVSVIGSSAEIEMVREIDNFYKAPMAGIKFLNQYKSGIKSSSFNFEKDDKQYPIHYVSTEMNKESGLAKLLVGPFPVDSTIALPHYSDTDFDKEVIDGADLYFEVGEVQHYDDLISWDLGKLNINSDRFTGSYIELTAKPIADNIFTKDGSLIVFENDLRPQYTTISLEAIAQ
ncbi:baseplate wedge subunit [Escherichia phage kvi]|uniref:Baseplate wedge protein gp6 n=1 Tax=Escherichia phage kvi TaxID=2696413 RepID=A0A6B9WYT8_9CAUD|nr:baseplate wedge subunit [Escherichia phage kvi]